MIKRFSHKKYAFSRFAHLFLVVSVGYHKKMIFTGDFHRFKCGLSGLFWFSFGKVRHCLSKFSTLVTSQNKVFFALSDASKFVFEKFCSTNFAK
jgi:hypothetical protein